MKSREKLAKSITWKLTLSNRWPTKSKTNLQEKKLEKQKSTFKDFYNSQNVEANKIQILRTLTLLVSPASAATASKYEVNKDSHNKLVEAAVGPKPAGGAVTAIESITVGSEAVLVMTLPEEFPPLPIPKT